MHERTLFASAADVGALLDDPARMWPNGWPPLSEDGLGFLRHEPMEYERGAHRLFRITGPNGFTGWHGWELKANGETVLRHVVEADCRGWARVGWPLVIRPIHNALHEDILDRAQAAVGGGQAVHPWSPWVRFLRWGIAKARKR